MKKYYCPYCGERALSSFQKASQKRTVSVGSNISNKLWFSCPACGEEVEKQQSETGKKINGLIIPCYIFLAIVFLFFAAMKMFELMICTFLAIMVLAIIMSFVGHKHDVFIRKSVEHDESVTVKATVSLNIKLVEQKIYIIKPKKNHINKTNISPMYIAALSNFLPEDKSCNVRFIKPLNANGLISTREFEIYDDHTYVGCGSFVD